MVLASLPPANTVTSVLSRGRNGSSRSMKFARMSRPIELPIAWISGLSTAPGMPRLTWVTVLPLCVSRRLTTCT